MPNALMLALMFFVGAAEGAPRSCLADVGKVKAQAYVDMCRFFSAATHPPCNVANPCATMQEEIQRTCTDPVKCVVPSTAGRWRCKDDACSDFVFTPAGHRREAGRRPS